MVWALILAITLYPLNQALARLGYQIFMGWVAANPVARRPAGDASETAPD